MYKLTGTIKLIEDTVQVTEKFSKREFVINDGAQEYPQDVLFQIVQDKCSILDKFGVGQEVEVSFNLRGREWTSPKGEVKHFNTLDAWRVEECSSSVGESAPAKSATSATVTEEAKDDLPF